ncbi:hypothetical protein M0R45_015917 [Rubus argutus]|uniref:Uncharacterized protein n=1 Tax=Rubus argutus TaxID=59490 RepID=A0AAW1XQL2_RUBAR
MVQRRQRTTQEMVIDEGSELDDGATLVNRDGICDGRDDGDERLGRRERGEETTGSWACSDGAGVDVWGQLGLMPGSPEMERERERGHDRITDFEMIGFIVKFQIWARG